MSKKYRNALIHALLPEISLEPLRLENFLAYLGLY